MIGKTPKMIVFVGKNLGKDDKPLMFDFCDTSFQRQRWPYTKQVLREASKKIQESVDLTANEARVQQNCVQACVCFESRQTKIIVQSFWLIDPKNWTRFS